MIKKRIDEVFINNKMFPIKNIRSQYKIGVTIKNRNTLKVGRIQELSYLRDYVMVAYSNSIENHYLENIEELIIIEKQYE